MRQTYKEAIKYGIVGISGLIVEWLTFFLFRDVACIDYSVAHVLSAVCGTINNFIFNRIYTFKATDKPLKRALSFFGIAAIGWVVGYFLITGFVYLFDHYLFRFLSMDEMLVKDNQAIVQNIAKLCAIVIVAGLQFFANKYITFKKH
ncbi:MAG: GtrA family protein [Prevotella sp.]|nr:GtrA family protein [Prevotella sp.]